MADGVSIKLEGFDELDKLLLKLPRNLRKKNLRRATRRAMVITRDNIKATAPQSSGSGSARSGRLRRLVKVKPRRGKRGYLKVSLIYPTTEKSVTGIAGRDNPKDAFYWRFVEFGTRNVPANPYIQRAVDSTFSRVVRTLFTETTKGVKAELAKLRTRA